MCEGRRDERNLVKTACSSRKLLSLPAVLAFCCVRPWELAEQLLGSLRCMRLGGSSVQK